MPKWASPTAGHEQSSANRQAAGDCWANKQVAGRDVGTPSAGTVTNLGRTEEQLGSDEAWCHESHVTHIHVERSRHFRLHRGRISTSHDTAAEHTRAEPVGVPETASLAQITTCSRPRHAMHAAVRSCTRSRANTTGLKAYVTSCSPHTVLPRESNLVIKIQPNRSLLGCHWPTATAKKDVAPFNTFDTALARGALCQECEENARLLTVKVDQPSVRQPHSISTTRSECT